MSNNNAFETLVAIWKLLVLIVQIPIFIIGCIAQPFFLYLHLQDEKVRWPYANECRATCSPTRVE